MAKIILVRKHGYDRWASIYDHDLNPLPALEEPVFRAAVGDVRGLSVVDLGCGTGRHAIWLAGGAAVIAIDFSEGMLAEASTNRRGTGRIPDSRFAPTFAVSGWHV